MSLVLLVDDDADLRALLRDLLEMMGHEVIVADDGREGLARAHERRPDLVVTDWRMPRMDGVELCEHLLAEASFRSVPLLLHSTELAPVPPGVSFLRKSGEPVVFETCVERLLTGARELSPEPDPLPFAC